MPDTPADVMGSGPKPGSTKPGMPRWVKAFVIIGVVLAVLVVLMLTGVLGKGHGPRRHFGGGMPQAMNIGAPADAAAATRTIEVTASDALAFDPATIEVSAGEIVALAVTNRGKTPHEFTLGDAAMHQEHARMMAHIPAGMAHDTPNSIQLEPGETQRLAWRFGDAGTLEYACHVQGHYQSGMRGTITIT